MHLEVAGLLGRPFASRIRRAGRDPNASRLDMDKDQEVEINHAFDCPLSLRCKVALPHGGRMALEKVRPSVGMVAGIRAESSLDQNVFDGLTRDPMADPAHRLDDLGVAPAGLFADPDNRIGDAL